jgi:predicted nucleic acid-binding protein
MARALGSMDAFVAATAEAHALTLVTRNVKDFERICISLLDPWVSRPAGRLP